MSWRLNIVPAMTNPDLADWTIPPDATPEQVDTVTDACLPHGLKVFAPTAGDWRLRRVMERLETEHGFPPTVYDVFIRVDSTVDPSGWVQL